MPTGKKTTKDKSLSKASKTPKSSNAKKSSKRAKYRGPKNPPIGNKS